MKNRSLPLVRTLVCGATALLPLFAAASSKAADFPMQAPVQAPARVPAQQFATGRIYVPSDLENLRGVRGQIVTVEGTLVRAGESKSKTVRYLNFTNDYRESLALVFFVGKGGDLFSMEKLHSWIGKRVRATGRISEYGSNVQMEIERWEQVREMR